MSVAISLTEDQTLAALRAFILTLVEDGVEVVAGQDNRVPAPLGPNYVVMTPITQRRLATNVVTYSDGYLTDPITDTGARQDMASQEVTVQIDVHGPNSATTAWSIAVMLRSDYGVEALASSGFDVTPLFASEPRQGGFLNDSQQIEQTWMVDAVLQCKPVITTEQDFADQLGLGLIAADVVSPIPVPERLNRLGVIGSDIVGPDRKPVTLRGMNWGRWGTVQPQDAADHVAQGANCVRIPLRWWGLYSDGTSGIDSRDEGAQSTALINPDNLVILDQMMQWASDAGLWIILFIDSDCGQNGLQNQQQAQYCDPDGGYPGGHNFWTDLNERAKFIAVWQFVAARYKHLPHLGIFECFPEPNPLTASNADIAEFYTEVMDAVTLVAPGFPFMVGPRSYDITKSDNAYNPAWAHRQVIYTGDLFLFPNAQPDALTNSANRLQHLLDLRTAHNVPIFVQQVGVNSGDDDAQQTYVNGILGLLNSNNVGWAWWEYRDLTNPNAYGVWYQDAQGNWIVKQGVLDAIDAHYVPARLTIDGPNILLPDGTAFFPAGTNQRWNLAKQADGTFVKTTLMGTLMRIEWHWWENGVAGDARDDTAVDTGYINPAFLAQLDQYVFWYTAAGLWVDIAWHTQCGRGYDVTDPQLTPYCLLGAPQADWPQGRNVWNDPDSYAKAIAMWAFIANRYKNTPRMAWYEPMNEPNAPSQQQVNLFYRDAIAAIRAQDPLIPIMVGGTGGYNTSKVGVSVMTDIPGLIYTFDWFDQPGNDAQNPIPIETRKANLLQRFQQPLQVRAHLNVPVMPEQFGSHVGADPDREILDYQVSLLEQNQMPFIHWELTSPAIGPDRGASNFGMTWQDGQGGWLFADVDIAIVTRGCTTMNSLRGTLLQ